MLAFLYWNGPFKSRENEANMMFTNSASLVWWSLFCLVENNWKNSVSKCAAHWLRGLITNTDYEKKKSIVFLPLSNYTLLSVGLSHKNPVNTFKLVVVTCQKMGLRQGKCRNNANPPLLVMERPVRACYHTSQSLKFPPVKKCNDSSATAITGTVGDD